MAARIGSIHIAARCAVAPVLMASCSAVMGMAWSDMVMRLAVEGAGGGLALVQPVVPVQHHAPAAFPAAIDDDLGHRAQRIDRDAGVEDDQPVGDIGDPELADTS